MKYYVYYRTVPKKTNFLESAFSGVWQFDSLDQALRGMENNPAQGMTNPDEWETKFRLIEGNELEIKKVETETIEERTIEVRTVQRSYKVDKK